MFNLLSSISAADISSVTIAEIVAMLTPILIGFGIKLLKVFLIWVIGRWVSKRVVKLARTIMEKHAVNLSIRTFVASLVDVVALIIILIM